MVTSIDLVYPFTGRWLVHNSPADTVPSHGTPLFATSFAIDFVPVDEDGVTAPFTPLSLVRTQPPDDFPRFGRTVLSPVAGTVLAVHDSEEDHSAYRGLPSLCYALTQRHRVRAGWNAPAGNHVLIRHATGVVVALCHLQSSSAVVRPAQEVRAGDVLGRCGNSGNSTEPHLHVQAVDTGDIAAAQAVPLSFGGRLPHNGEIVVVPDR
ncbi:MAG: M23 family metallopeptidase [Propionibacterium sp.]|nr:M23 family metallopeptidase [Actinomyces sp.]MDN6794284.1 M23 family metallopeptidase [Propionibacterium sp.]